MNRKLVLMLTLTLLIGMLNVAFNVQRAKASGTVYIKADGSIDPRTAPISTLDNVTYTFTDNINDSIMIERDGVVVDGAGYTDQGTGDGTGIDLSNRNNVTIKNVHAETFFYGIYLYNSSDNSLFGNQMTANSYGIMLADSSNNTISGNSMMNNDWGIQLYWSPNTTLRSNNASNNKYNFAVYGGFVSNYLQDVDVSNTVNGKPVYYWINRQNEAVPSNVGYVALVNCTNVTLKNLNLTNNGQGVLLAYTSNSTITKNNIRSNWEGVHLYESSSNTISANDITVNKKGMLLNEYSSYNTIYGNNVTNNDEQGIELENYSTYNDVYGNNMAENSLEGIEIGLGSSYNNVYGNNATNNRDGVYLYESHNNIVANNTAKGNTECGIFLWNSGNNILTNNNLTENWLDLGVNAEYLDGFYQSIDSSNLVNGKPVYYIMDLENTIVTPKDYPNIGYLALIKGNNVTLENIILQDAGALVLAYSMHCCAKNVNVVDCTFGVWLLDSYDNTISNIAVSSSNVGIVCLDSVNNTFFENVFNNNECGIWTVNSNIGTFHHNDFLNNSQQVRSEQSTNIWDDGYPSCGNYWSDYNGTDLQSGLYQNDTSSDGIGDTPYTIDPWVYDHYPLMGRFSDFNATSEYLVQTVCNSSISNFQFNGTAMSFDVSGENDTAGFCRICIPTAVMNSTYKVFVNGTEVQCNLLPCSNSTHSYLYFTYSHSTKEIVIVPEFPSFLILPLFMIVTLLTVIVYKRKRTDIT